MFNVLSHFVQTDIIHCCCYDGVDKLFYSTEKELCFMHLTSKHDRIISSTLSSSLVGLDYSVGINSLLACTKKGEVFIWDCRKTFHNVSFILITCF